MVGDEGPRQGAAVERLQNGRLDLDEAVLVEPAADLADGAGAQGEEAAALLVGHQVELALPVAGLDILEAVELAGRRPQALRQQSPAVDRQRQLTAAPGRQSRPLDPDDVADVEVDEQLEGLGPEQVLAGVQLDLAAAVAEVEEGRLAVAAAGDDAAGNAVAGVGFGAGGEPLVSGAHLRDLLPFAELMRERLDARVPQPLQLLAAVAEDVGEVLSLGLAHQHASLSAGSGPKWAKAVAIRPPHASELAQASGQRPAAQISAADPGL